MSPWFKKKNPLYSSKKISVKLKGLSNQPGQNNCFLNSAVQVLWHLDAFRVNFGRMRGHICVEEDSCIFCAMKHLFARFTNSDQDILPPDDLRAALATFYKAQKRFQLGLMDDAAECFENLLLRIHSHIVEENESDDICSAKHCISHQKFGMMIIEQGVCGCGERSEPLPFVQLVHYVSATALCAKLKSIRRKHRSMDRGDTFGSLIRSAGSIGGRKRCPSNCGSEIETRASLMNAPDVISVGVNWDSAEPTVQHIIDLIDTLSTTIRLQDMYDVVLDKQAQKNKYHISALVCYYGKHYSTIFFNRKTSRWVTIDDAAIIEIGKHWKDVLDKCVRGRYQPLLLLYTNYEAQPLFIDSALKTKTITASSVASSPALSRRDSEVGSSSSGSLSPAHVPILNGAATRSKNFQWNASPLSANTGHYKEPKAGMSFTKYRPYANPTTYSLKSSSNDVNGNGNSHP